MPKAAPAQIRNAVLAHMLAVIEAFGTDRIQDGQIKDSARLQDLLAYLRLARDRAILRLTDDHDPYAAADRETRDAILAERAMLNRAEVSTFPQYEAISLGKQSVGFPATLALARAAGLENSELVTMERALACVWLGLQFEDDVMDWEDDWRRGGAWAVCLARGERIHFRSNERPTVPNALQRFVLESQVLPRMLGLARRKYRAVRRRALVLGGSQARIVGGATRTPRRISRANGDQTRWVRAANAAPGAVGFGGVAMTRPCWDFHYVPVAAAIVDDGRPAVDLIVATEADVDPALIAGALASLGTDVAIEPLLSLHPLFWTRVRAGTAVDRAELQRRVEATGVRVRYVASSRHCSTKPAPILDLSSARPRHPLRWQKKANSQYHDPRSPRPLVPGRQRRRGRSRGLWNRRRHAAGNRRQRRRRHRAFGAGRGDSGWTLGSPARKPTRRTAGGPGDWSLSGRRAQAICRRRRSGSFAPPLPHSQTRGRSVHAAARARSRGG